MRNLFCFLSIIFLTLLSSSNSFSCNLKKKLGISRTIEVDTKGGALYGTVQYKNTLDLKPGEVVLTFDDGPHPKNTISILKTLKDHCLKATFFAVGKMIRTYPKVLKQVSDEGHTIAAHTFSHPNLPSISATKAKYEIERSFAEAIQATGKPVAPFFRFPGLAHSHSLNKYLATRNIATLSVDIVSNDSYYRTPGRIIRNIMSTLKEKKSGIILMHDLKATTAKALPTLLYRLKAGGYKIVHIVPKKVMKTANFTPLPYKQKIRTASLKKTPHKSSRRKKYNSKRRRYLKRKLASRHRKYRNHHYAANRIKAQKLHRPAKLCFFLLFGCVR